jgi:preprotein translocase SecF subunit
MTFGLLANLFTGLTVTYTLCALYFAWRGRLSLGSLRIFKNTKIDFIGLRRITIPSSIALIVVALGLVLSKGGLQFGVDFAGGLSAEVQFADASVKEGAIREALKGLSADVIPVIDLDNTYLLDMPLAVASDAAPGTEASAESTEQLLKADLTKAFGEGKYTLQNVDSFDPQIGAEFSRLALLVVALASGSILIYLWLRFELAFGVAAVIALCHDLIIVVLLSTLWNVQITLDTVAALMVLLGFSVNDTIVIFDRIREDTRTIFGKSFKDHCNHAMNMTLSRTIITSGTVWLTVLVLLLVGGTSLQPFAKVILIGAIVGTYSSDFIAAPLVHMWNEYKGDRLQQTLAAKKKRVEAAKPIGRPAAR